MSIEDDIRAAYKTQLGREVESDAALQHWAGQGANWNTGFQSAVAAEVAGRKPTAPAAPDAPATTPAATGMLAQPSREQQIRDAYQTQLGREVDSDASLGYWSNQGDDWQGAFSQAAAAEIAGRPKGNYPVLTGTQAQQQQQIRDGTTKLYGRTYDQLTAAGQGYGTGIGLYPGEGAADPNYMAYKAYNDDVTKRMREAGRTEAPANAVYRSKAVFDPRAGNGNLKIIGNDGTEMTNFAIGNWDALDRLGVDPESYKEAAAAMAASGASNGGQWVNDSNQYRPLFASAGDASYLKQGLDPTQNADPFFSNSAPSIKEFMDKTGLSFESASSMLSSSGMGRAGQAYVDWDKVMASSDPARALNSAYAAIAADPSMANTVTAGNKNNYAGWAMGSDDGDQSWRSGGNVGGVGGSSGASSGGDPTMRSVQYGTETIEGRIQNLLGTDAQGNYTNPVVQQAANRAMQNFAGRGLLNSSMAQQAAMEAATSKAIEIAGPDAQTYFSQGRANQDIANVLERDRRGYEQENMRFDKGQALEREKLTQAGSQFNQELKYKYDQLKLSDDSQKEAESRAHANALEINGITAVNRSYEMYLQRISDIDNNPNLDPATKVQMKNSAGKDFDLYARAKSIVWDKSLGDRFEAAKDSEAEKKAAQDAGNTQAGMLSVGSSYGTGDSAGGAASAAGSGLGSGNAGMGD